MGFGLSEVRLALPRATVTQGGPWVSPPCWSRNQLFFLLVSLVGLSGEDGCIHHRYPIRLVYLAFYERIGRKRLDTNSANSSTKKGFKLLLRAKARRSLATVE
jgi:hypothetical protein